MMARVEKDVLGCPALTSGRVWEMFRFAQHDSGLLVKLATDKRRTQSLCPYDYGEGLAKPFLAFCDTVHPAPGTLLNVIAPM
ncbi:MAG: hypothetical protein C4332_15300 [Meiothermus sp.]